MNWLGNLAIGFIALTSAAGHAKAEPPATALSVATRLAARRAIEEVYWRHRIWPTENPQPKPELSSLLSDDELRARIEDDLMKSNALDRIWHRPLTGGDLSVELERIAGHTQQPEILTELFAALGNDPLLIAEVLVRPLVADRRSRELYSNDRSLHAVQRQRAEQGLAALQLGDSLSSVGGEYSEVRVQRGDDSDRSATGFRAPTGIRPVIEEDSSAFTISIREVTAGGAVVVRTARWSKRPFEDWWDIERLSERTDLVPDGTTYKLPSIATTGCADGTWSPVRWSAPVARYNHLAVWTGSEMIVWGGIGGGGFAPETMTGGRYDPATDTWKPTRVTANSIGGVSDGTAIWTGTQMIVWGGYSTEFGSSNYGARYDPILDSWAPMSSFSTPRSGHTAIWTGSRMVVWGGYDAGSNTYLNTGGRYDPVSDSWSATSVTANTPTARAHQTAVWTNGKVLIWGGEKFGVTLNTGGGYDPATDVWGTPTSTGANVPSVRAYHSAVWTGTEMVVWGGQNGATNLNTGGRYKPSNNTWTRTSTGTNVPAARSGHTAVWTGSQMLVWGGGTSTGAKYTPASDSWSAMSTANSPGSGTAIWTGMEMVVWGGTIGTALTNTGGRYSPATNLWAPTSTGTNVPTARSNHSVLWTGAEILVWGGYPGNAAGGIYYPATDSWDSLSSAGAPSVRWDHSAVWTGTEMIIWGGAPATNTGGRYNPALSQWIPTAVGSNTPSARFLHQAAWTGTRMLVWGGQDAGSAYPIQGGLYDPQNDAWSPMNAGPGVPAGRTDFSAVWTGEEFIVWGGWQVWPVIQHYNTGGRYSPVTDAWTPTSIVGAVPCPRSYHTATWTGTEMMVFGGGGSSCPFPTNLIGGRYSPSTDSWIATSVTGSTPQLSGVSGVWTGVQFIIWGNGANPVGLGGHYDPTSDSWLPIPFNFDTPTNRNFFPAAWTGDQLFVWGGFIDNGAGDEYVGDGSMYCAAPCNTPGRVTSLVLTKGTSGQTILEWAPTPMGVAYDAVRGDLGVLRSTGGDFVSSTNACLAQRTGALAVVDPATPTPGGGFWYLIRSANCAVGSYDDGTQIGSRDAEIAAAPATCS